MDYFGKTVINFMYRRANEFAEGLASVTNNIGSFYIDMENKRVSPIYQSAYNFSENGLALVKKDNKYYFIDLSFNIKISVPLGYKPKPFKGKFAPLEDINTKTYLLLDQEGDTHANSLILRKVQGVSEGIIRVKRPSKGNYISTNYLNEDLKVIASGFARGIDFQNGYAGVSTGKIGIWGFIDYEGNTVIEPKYAEVRSFSQDGIAAVRNKFSSNWSFIDVESNIVMENKFRFEDADTFSEGLCPICLKTRNEFLLEYSGDELINDRWGFIDQHGDLKINPIFDKVDKFKNGVAKVYSNGKFSYINQSGEFVGGAPLRPSRIMCK